MHDPAKRTQKNKLKMRGVLMTIGILALQGGFEAHARVLTHLGAAWCYVRAPADLAQVQGMILPGGESSTQLKLLQTQGLFALLQAQIKKGMPFLGTCAGAILLAKQVQSPEQISLGAVDVTIERNAYGRQLASQIVYGHSLLKKTPMEMFFIRAPRFSDLPPHITPLADYEGQTVCVQQNACILATFHPELTQDTTLHEYFLTLIDQEAV
jgi:5'-phosphate synthase pdxT subunit